MDICSLSKIFYNFADDYFIGIMSITKEHRVPEYIAPEVNVIELVSEGGLCQSGTEGLGEKPGNWD